MSALKLDELEHPDPAARAEYERLVGIEENKEALLEELVALFDGKRMKAWERKHHPAGLALTSRLRRSAPLVLLSGEVGCGKSALSFAVGTPLADRLDRKVLSLQSPSDVRGWGHVGELSARVTALFEQARARARSVGTALLIIDEADDLGTARSQNAAHHEDRAGVNVLVKELALTDVERDRLVTIVITNRRSALDPALLRRCALQLEFERPTPQKVKVVFSALFAGVKKLEVGLDALVAAATRHETPPSYSDLVDRLARGVLRRAAQSDQPVSVDLVLSELERLTPTPLMESES